MSSPSASTPEPNAATTHGLAVALATIARLSEASSGESSDTHDDDLSPIELRRVIYTTDVLMRARSQKAAR